MMANVRRRWISLVVSTTEPRKITEGRVRTSGGFSRPGSTFEINALQILRFGKGGRMVRRVAGRFQFNEAASGTLRGLPDGVQKFRRGNVRGARGRHQDAVAAQGA